MRHKGKSWEPFFHHCYGSYSPPVTSCPLRGLFFLHVLFGSKLRLRSHLYGDRLSQVEGSPTYPLATQRGCKESQFSTLQVQVFAWSPLGNQLFGFGETFLRIKSPACHSGIYYICCISDSAVSRVFFSCMFSVITQLNIV